MIGTEQGRNKEGSKGGEGGQRKDRKGRRKKEGIRNE